MHHTILVMAILCKRHIENNEQALVSLSNEFIFSHEHARGADAREGNHLGEYREEFG